MSTSFTITLPKLSSITNFLWYDYMMFVIVLIGSALTGIYAGWSGRKGNTTQTYLSGGKKNRAIAIACSLAASHFSAIAILGYPSDTYRYGAVYIWIVPTLILVGVLTISVYLPVFWNLKFVSVYEYLGLRFDKKARLIASSLNILFVNLQTPILIYGPSLALSTATGINVHIISMITCGTCLLYTAVGGLKAVIWTDLIQLLVITIALLAVVSVSFYSFEEFSQVWMVAQKGHRFNFLDLDPNPTKRQSLWIIVFGFTADFLGRVSIDQTGVQKLLATSSFKESGKSVVYFVVIMSLIYTLFVLIGLTVYARYSGCDPVLYRAVGNHDQLVLYFIFDVTRNTPGVSGLFIAALFCGALSSVSSSFNAVSGVIYEDFVKEFIVENPKESLAYNLLRTIVVVEGIICMMILLVIPSLGDLFPLAVSITGLALGPQLGMFTLGLLSTKANATGSFYGAICGFLAALCILVPSKYYQIHGLLKYPHEALGTEACYFPNSTLVPESVGSDKMAVPAIFYLSPYYITLLGAIVTYATGYIISCLFKTKKSGPSKNLLSPVYHYFLSSETNRSHSHYRSMETIS